MRTDFVDLLELLKLAKLLGSSDANNKEGIQSAHKTLSESKLFSGFNLDQLLGMKANEEMVARVGMQEIDIGSPEFVDFDAAMPSMLLSSSSSCYSSLSFGSKKKNSLPSKQDMQPICKLSEIGQKKHDDNDDDDNNNSPNFVQAIKDGEFAFYVLKVQDKYYKMTSENMVELSFLLLPDSLKEMLKKFGMSEIELRKMLSSKFNHAKE